MRKIYTLLSILGIMLTASPGMDAHKRGIFDPTKNSPEKAEASLQQKAPRQTLESPVFRRGMTANKKPVEAVTANQNFNGALSAKKAVPQNALGDGTEIYGSMIYSTAWAGTTGGYGIYSFPASQYQAPAQVYPQGSYEANGGGCYYNGKYYWNSYVYTDEMGYTFTTFCTYDFATKEETRNILSFINDNFDLQQITNGLTVDPTTGRMYALANIKVVDETGAIARYYPSFSEVDPYTGFATPIAQISQMLTIAANAGGEIYTISRGAPALLYHINKTTGACTLIGSTGVNADYAQSMTFDPVTGKLYWAAVRTNGSSGLYEVNTATGAASLIFEFGNNEEYTGLYIPEPSVSAGAPAGVPAIETKFENGALTGAVTVTVPEKTYNGAPLSGNLKLTLLTDSGNAETVNATPGQTMTFDRTLAEGLHTFTAYATNDAGDGVRISKAVYVGVDAPGAVGNLKLQATDDGKAHLSWSAPVIGRHNGYIDPSQITYTVTRFPDNVAVAKNITSTYFTDPVDLPASNFYYEVKGYCGNREGVGTYTEEGLFGKGSALPCRFSLNTKEEYELFTVIDANGDWEGDYKWGGWMFGADFKYTNEDDLPCAVYGYHPEYPADDWLITPPVEVEKGKKYRLTFNLWTRGQNETIEVTAAPANTIAAQAPILAKTDYNHKDHRKFTVDFTAQADGNYFVGFHITSKKKQYYAFVSDIMVDAVPDTDAPVAVSGLTAAAGAYGAKTATLTFTAPAQTVGGQSLTSIDKIEVYHGVEKTPVATLNANPNATVSWTDTNVEGMIEYRVVPYANGKAGEKAVAMVFVGWDTPLPVTNLKADDASGHPVITWTAPAEGVNGGYINSSELKYAVYRYEDDLTLLADNVSGTTYTDNAISDTEQHLVAYLVLAKSPVGYSEPSVTNNIIFGKPYVGEFYESFEDTSVHSTPWVMYRLKGNVQNWGVTSYGTNPRCQPVDGDGGMAVYSTDGRVGDEGLLVSPKLNIASIPNPVFTFYFYHNYTDEHEAWDEGFEDRFIPEVMLPDGSSVALHDPIYVDDLGVGWLKYSCDLTPYKNYDYIRLALHGITACEQDVYVDRLSVTNLISNDLQAYSFTGPSSVEAEEECSYKLTVYNRGAEKVEGGAYTVDLYDGSQKVATMNGVEIGPKEFKTFVFSLIYPVDKVTTTHSLYAYVDWADDEIVDNNMSNTIRTYVSRPALPEVNDLAAQVSSNNVTLSWGAPNSLKYEDSFENYTPFGIEDFAGYKMIDGDGNNTWGFQSVYFDNAGAPQAFMVFDPVSLGVVDYASALFPYDSFDPHTGNMVLACFQGYTLTGENSAVSATNDDWFISPEIFGGQTIRFFAKSGDYMQGLDKFQVMYSVSGTSAASFHPLGEVVTTGKDWTLYEYKLPETAKYFAIHCVSEDGFALFIDDLEFVAHRELGSIAHTGYNLYRDGICLAELPVSTTTFNDPALADGKYTYWVKAKYADGRESANGNKVEVRIGDSGVEDIAGDVVKIYAENGSIIVTGLHSDSMVRIYTPDGKVYYSAVGGDHRVLVEKGIYIVKAADKTCRLIVK